jgi:hypothetical protein
MVGFPVLHDVPPCFDDSGGDQLPRKAGAAWGAGQGQNGTLSQNQPLLPMARLNV